jgi:hypothetical protein
MHVTELMGCADGLVRILRDVTPSLSQHHVVCWSNQDEFAASTSRGATNQCIPFCSSDSAQPHPPALTCLSCALRSAFCGLVNSRVMVNSLSRVGHILFRSLAQDNTAEDSTSTC